MSVMFRDPILASILLGTLFTASTAHAEENCTPIRFGPGTSSATIKGTASSMDDGASSACFTLTTRAGQTATIKIVKKSRNDDTAFTITDLVDNQDDYTFKTQSKTYTIGVYLTFARQSPRPFTMQVSVR
jgi:hypothetical protein